jgi:hypothetical protein
MMNPIPRRIKQRPWAPTESLAYITPREGKFLRAHPDAPNAARLPDIGPLQRINGIPAYWGVGDGTGAGAEDSEGAGHGMGHDDGGEDADAGFGADIGGYGEFGDAMTGQDDSAFGADQTGGQVGLSGPESAGMGGYTGWGGDITGQGYSDPNMTAYDSDQNMAAALAEDAMMKDRDAGIVAAMARAASKNMDWGNLVKDQDTARERAIRNRDKHRARDLDPAVERAMWTDEKDIVPFLSKLLGLTPFDRLANMQRSPFDDPDGEWGGGDSLQNVPIKLSSPPLRPANVGPSGWVGSYEPGGQLVRTGQDEELLPQGLTQELMQRYPSIARRNRPQFEDFGNPLSTIGGMIG